MSDTKMCNFHICCLVLGLLLLATSLTHVHGAEPIYSFVGAQEFFRNNNNNSTKCDLTLPDKTTCSYTYGSGTTPPPTGICDIRIDVNKTLGICEFGVNITSKSLSGIYTLKYTATDTPNGEESFTVYVLTGKDPANNVLVVQNENVYVVLEDYFGSDTDKKCEADFRNRTSAIVLNSTWASPYHWGTKDECGFKIEGVSATDGYLSILRMSGSDTFYTYARFSLTVIPLDQFDIVVKSPVDWFFGGTETISEPQYPHSKYCEIWSPQNKMVLRDSGNPVCSYQQDVATYVDEGNWTFVFGIDGKLFEDTIVKEVIIKKSEMQMTVSDSERFPGGKSLLCSLNLGSVEDCNFTRPDGKVILLGESIGNADYSYFGNGFRNGDCGLTIHNVQEEDEGWWKCVVLEATTLKQWSGLMNVSTNVTDPEVNTHAGKVVATTSQVLSLSCGAQASLDYCWFRHPSGFSLPFNTTTPWAGYSLQYEYEDKLSQGVCSVTIHYASIQHSGEWTCNVGILGSSNEDYAVPIKVGISDTGLASVEKEMIVPGDSALLKCYSVPLEVPLDYCRFIRPDGKGFNVDIQNNETLVLGRYLYEGDGLDKGECGIRIVSGLKEDEDMGKWTCVARLQGRTAEGFDFITLRREDVISGANVGLGGLSMRTIIGIVLGSVALLLV